MSFDATKWKQLRDIFTDFNDYETTYNFTDIYSSVIDKNELILTAIDMYNNHIYPFQNYYIDFWEYEPLFWTHYFGWLFPKMKELNDLFKILISQEYKDLDYTKLLRTGQQFMTTDPQELNNYNETNMEYITSRVNNNDGMIHQRIAEIKLKLPLQELKNEFFDIFIYKDPLPSELFE